MVEGPQCSLKTTSLQVIVGAYVLSANGDCLAKAEGRKVERVVSVGKECFIVLQDIVLRLHFGMAGSMRISRKHPQSHPDRNKLSASLVLSSRAAQGAATGQEERFVLIYDSNVQVKTSEYLTATELRASLDILAPNFDGAAVIRLLRSDGRSICDTILDQKILPGVGNLIKCEGLFGSSIDPLAISSELPEPRLWVLVRALRDFSAYWYDCCRRHKPASKKVYGQAGCPDCLQPIVLIRSGEGHLKRITYYCSSCQAASSGPHVRKPAVWGAPQSNLIVQPTVPIEDPCTDATSSPPSIDLTRREPQPVHMPPLSQKSCKCGDSASLQRVRKSGPNSSRLFWSCRRRTKACGFFEWADALFPLCSCRPARRSILRRVLKVGANNGRYFFSCAAKADNGCGFFSWANGEENPRKKQRVDGPVVVPL